MPADQAKERAKHLPAWRLEGRRLVREWHLADFAAAVKFLDDVGRIAQRENHHPDLHLTGYSNVRVETMTHSVGGVTENDFILAAKIEAAAPMVPAR